MSWKKVKLGDIATVTSSKRIFARQYTNTGIPFYRQKEIIDKKNKLEITEPLFISKNTYLEIKNKFGAPQKGDLLITAVGVTLGIAYVVRDEEFYFKDGNLIWLKDFIEEVNSHYIYYWVNSDVGQKSMWSRTIGSAQPALTIDTIKQFEIKLPTLNKQNKIADILSNYDNLIENNQKQIKLLEEAAQRLYKEWFIDLHFPGYKNANIIDGVPEGWFKSPIGDLIDKSYRSKQVKTADYMIEGDIPVVDQSRAFIAGYTNDIETVVDLGKPVIVFGDHTRILKYIQFPFAKGADGTQLIVSNCENMPQVLLYFSLLNVDLSNYHYARHFKYLKAEEIIVPDKTMAEKYDDIATNIMKKVHVLREQIRNAEQARDRLLPKLMSGEIEV